MRKITLMIIVSLLSFCTYGQLALEQFESPWTGTPGAPPGGWVVYNQIGNTTWVRSPLGNTNIPPYQGDHAAYLDRENVAPSAPIPTNWLITPQFNSPNNGQLHFYSKLTFQGDFGGIYKIKIAPVTDPLVPAANLPWVDLVLPMGELEMNPIQLEYVEKVFNIPAAYVGQQIRIAFIMEGDQRDRWLIDNVEVVSQCTAPSTLSATETTLTTAKLGWISPAGVTSWEVEVVEDSAVPTGTGVVYSGPLPYPKTGLTANTDYKFYVRSVCSDGGKSAWVGPFFFITPALGEKCGEPLVIPTTPPLPYVTVNNTTNFADNYEGIPGTGCGATGNYLAGNDVVYSYTPTTSGTINISLSNTGGNAGVFVYSSCTNIGVSCLAGVTASATAAGVIPALVVTAGTTYYIVVSTNGTPQVTPYTLTLQQVYCAAPTALAANTQTSSSANLTWAAGTATAWQIAVQTPGSGLPMGAGQNVTQNTITATSTSAGVLFNPATAYEYYVRANCGDGTYSIWSGPFAFSTTQIPVSLGYTENFDGPVAHGWSISNAAQVNKWFVGPATFNSAPNSLYVSNDNGLTNAYTITSGSVVHAYRDIQIPAGAGEISISFDLKVGGQSNTDYVRAWLVPVTFNPLPGTQLTAANSGGVQVGGNFQLTPNWTTQNVVVNAAPFANTVRRLVFEWRNDTFTGTQPAGAIDNFIVKAVTCSAPSALTLASATQTSATYTWTAPAGAPPAGYEYYYSQNPGAGPVAATTPSGSVVGGTTTTATISPLNPSETYYMWVRSSCGADKSFWVGPIAVVVPQIPGGITYTQNFDGGAHSFSFLNGDQPNKWIVGSAVSNSSPNSLYITNDNGVTNAYTNTLSVTQAYRDLTIPMGAGEIDITFDFKCVGESDTFKYDYLRVWMVPVTYVPVPGTQIVAAADRIKVGGDMNLTPGGNWTTINLDTPVTAYQGTTRRLVFEWRNDGVAAIQSPAAIDNINITVVTCPKPSGLTAIATSTNATLDWTEAGSATNWEVAYMPALGATTPSGAGIPVATTSEHTPAVGTFVYGTQYVFYVRANCGGATGFSKWSGPFTFMLKPVNDDCATPTVVLTNPDLNCTNFVNGSITGATLSPETTTCIGTKDDDVWYEFVATNTSHNINFNNVTGTTADLVHGVYSGNACGALTLLYCSDPNNSVANNLVVGQTYKIRVWTWTATTGQTSAFQLCITTPPPPPLNDPCSGAFTLPVNPTLTCADTVAGTIYSATASPEVSTCAGTEDDDIWYKFVATNVTHRISILNITGSTTFLNHVVYSGTDCTALTQLYCGATNESWANGLTIGQTYYVRIYSNTATAGQTSAFNVCVGTPPPPPANDECAGAVTVPVNPTMVCQQTVPGTIVSATASPEANTCGNTNDDDDVWFEFTATNTAHIIELKNIVGSTTDLYHAVYTGDVCGTLTQLYCSDGNLSLALNFTVGQTYKIRVWSNTATLNQTSAFEVCVGTPPPPPSNDDCANAIVAPVNQTSVCTLTAQGSLFGSTASAEPNTCGGDDADDIWFQFTATHPTLLISLKHIIGSTADLFHVVYAGDQCGSLTQLYCSDANSSVASNLIVGNVYKVRVYSNTALVNQTSTFDICIRVPNTPITVSTTAYTTEQLVTDILVSSECALVSNITSSSGTNFANGQSIGYFDANGAAFPFSYGAVLSTGAVASLPGPYTGAGSADTMTWPGDAELKNIVVTNDPTMTSEMYNATTLEFDFIPLTNLFTFQFLFASNEYGTFQCGYSDAFAFILTDADGNKKNLAVIPNTTIPVGVTTIRNAQYLQNSCASANEGYFDQFNAESPLGSAINLGGQTIPLTASSEVVPNTQYHIKLVIADYQDAGFNSAVFLGGGTFDVGELELGGNLLVDEGDALCNEDTTVLDTELSPDDYIFKWYKNGILIDGETGPSYEVTESGTYGVEATFETIACSYEGIVVVEFFPLIEDITGDPVNLVACDASGFHTFDITPNVDAILAGSTTPTDFTNTVHLTEDDAKAGINPIDAATYAAYTNVTEDLQTLWIRTVHNVTTCVGIKSFDLVVQDLTPQYTIDADFSICDGTSDTIDIVLTDTDPNPVTYVWTKDGVTLADTTPSITVTETGAYTVVLDRTGCSTTATVNVVVTPIPVADAPADVTECGSYTLPALNAGNKYYNAATNDEVLALSEVIETTTFNVVASSGTTPDCTSQNTFTVTINPIPVVASPGDQAACDSYVLPELANAGNAYYTGQNGTGDLLDAGDVISATQTIYVYQETSTVPNCSAEESFVVTINTTPVADTPGDVNVCDSYVLPALSAGNSYFTGQNGSGLELLAGQLISTSQDIYVFAQTSTTPNCTAEHLFHVEITPTPAFSLGGPYKSCVYSNITINVTGANFNDGDATYVWTLEDGTIPGGSSIVASGFGTYSLTVTVNNCSHTEFIEVEQDTTVIDLIITDGCDGGTYKVSVADDNGSFNIDTASYAWTGPGEFTSTEREFNPLVKGEYFVTVTTPDGCIGEDSVIVIDTSCNIQRGISPNGDGSNDAFDLTSLNVKKLIIFNRYGQEVYSKNDYKKEWFGQTDSGDELPTGTYFYMIERETGETHTGWIYINRQD